MLNYLFKIQSREINSINELNEKHRIKNVLDNALNPEMEKLSREYENEANVTDIKNEEVVFTFDILNKMLSKMKRIYMKSSKDIGYENGTKKKYQTYKNIIQVNMT